MKQFFNDLNEKKCTCQQIWLWASFKSEEEKPKLFFLFYLFLILHASLEKDFSGVRQDAVLINRQNLWQIKTIDSKIFEDNQCVKEIASKNTNMKVLKTKKVTIKPDGFAMFKHTSEWLPF